MFTKWSERSINKKIQFFVLSLILVIVVSVYFDGWVAKLLLVDVEKILEVNKSSNDFIAALDTETAVFTRYMKSAGDETFLEQLDASIQRTGTLLKRLPYKYQDLDELRYIKRWSIQNTYEVYCESRDELIEQSLNGEVDVDELYKVYEMQDYLKQYSQEFMSLTVAAGNEAYTKMTPTILLMPTAIAVVAIILLVIILIMGYNMEQTIVAPVLSLANAAKRIASDEFYIEDVHVENKDEIGDLVETFNKMKYATGEYIRTIEEKRRTEDKLHEQEVEKLAMENELERMEFNVLRSQINPHFLFNTLNIITGMATLEDAPKTEAMIQALSSIFRYNLKTPETEVALSQEIKVVSDYMYIQKMRFGDRITYDLKCEVDQNSVMIPTFTLQPLVENAIIHGLSKKEDGGEISISIYEKDQMIVISVKDNGLGMTKEQRDALLGLDSSVKNKGMGLGNIIKRIKGLYSNGSVDVFSEENKGCEVVIELPISIREDEYND